MRRSRFSGWNDESPAKPVEPLRYRISRTEKALDNLDSLDRELRATGMDCEDKEHLGRLLAVQRAKLAAKLNKELGHTESKPTKPKQTPSKAPRRPAKAPKPSRRYHRRPLLSNGAKWLIFVAVMAAIFF